MAYFQRRRGTQVTVKYWDKGKIHTLPRRETRHLDKMTDLEIHRWLEDWETQGGKKRERSRRRSIFSEDALAQWIKLHLEDHKALYSPRESTLQEYRYHFTYIEEYFVRYLMVKELKKWWQHTANFGTYLKTVKELETPTVRKICHTLARFGEFLVTQGEIAQPWLVRAPRSKGKRQTPLVRKMGPDEAKEHARTLLQQKRPIWAMEILLSYFGSLRPEEVYALEKADFLTGLEARRQAPTWERFQEKGFGSGLSVRINKTLTGAKVEQLTKTHYATGIVNIWDSEAAKMLAEILKDTPDGRLFAEKKKRKKTKEVVLVEWTRNQVKYRYGLYVKPVQGLNAGDRRRASANYLWRKLKDPVLLQDHLRHSEMETTLLYTRDPEIEDKEGGKQDFDDVV